YYGYGEVSDVAIKRKIRNRLQDNGEPILVQADERRNDSFRSIRDRVASIKELEKILKDSKGDVDLATEIACKTWFDVRSFGQVFAFKGDKLTLGIRGPVSIHSATSIE